MKSLSFGLIFVLLECVRGQSAATMAKDSAFNSSDAVSFRGARRSALADSCLTNDGSPGTCMTRFNCMRQNGAVKGYCGTYGVCCETNLQCSQTSRLKRTIIKNPAQITADSCSYTIEPYSTNVCQLLIEFQRFELMQPAVNPVDGKLECGDSFEVGGFILCGDNTQQHLYMPFSVSGGIEHIMLIFNTPNRWAQSTWRLVVTQLECPAVKRRSSLNSLMPFVNQNNLQDLRSIFSVHNSDLDLLAPAGCHQYYTQPSGNIKSLNYNEALGTLYMPETSYVICVKALAGATTIEYTVRKFSLSNEVIGSSGFDRDCHSEVHTPGRREDYLMMPQSYFANMPQFQPTYYCGTALTEKQVVLALPPFMMYFSSDDQSDNTETGFSIDYRVRTVL